MLFSFVALAIALFALFISSKLTDEILRLLMKLVGLLSIFFSLAHAVWLIQLLIALAIFAIPNCVQPQYQRQIRCSSGCAARPTCPYLPT